ncbi:MAG: hypothetical protein ACTHK2_16950 [Dokdonella sp.]|uniref:hypothetical protein n=1 Tax=Dokdonella sp. TaxID=2291710 RepID=UPI003F80186F
MSMPSSLARVALCASVALAALPAPARVLTLSRQDDATAIVRDAASGDVAGGTLAHPPDRLLVSLGALAADDANDLAYVAIAPDPSGAAPDAPVTVMAIAYGAATVPVGTFVAPDGFAFSALAFDAPRSRLVGVFADPAGVLPAQAFVVATHGGTSLDPALTSPIDAGCCRFAAGIAAWRAASPDLLMVGRRDGDGEDQLLRFDFAGGTALPAAYPIAGDRVVTLAVDGGDGSVYAVLRSVLDFTYLARVTWSTPGSPVTLSAIGSAPSTCCFIGGGPGTIDGATAERAMFVLGKAADAPAAMQLYAIDLASGAPAVVNPGMDGFGLWTDGEAVVDDVIFADGFD